MEDPIIALFCCLDDFARWRHGKLFLGEMLFIMMLLYFSPQLGLNHHKGDLFRGSLGLKFFGIK